MVESTSLHSDVTKTGDKVILQKATSLVDIFYNVTSCHIKSCYAIAAMLDLIKQEIVRFNLSILKTLP